MNRLGIACDIGSMLKAAKRVEEKKSFRPMKYLLGSNLRRKILERFQVSNQRLAQDFGVVFDNRLPGEEDAYPVEHPSIDYTLALVGMLQAE